MFCVVGCLCCPSFGVVHSRSRYRCFYSFFLSSQLIVCLFPASQPPCRLSGNALAGRACQRPEVASRVLLHSHGAYLRPVALPPRCQLRELARSPLLEALALVRAAAAFRAGEAGQAREGGAGLGGRFGGGGGLLGGGLLLFGAEEGDGLAEELGVGEGEGGEVGGVDLRRADGRSAGERGRQPQRLSRLEARSA